MDYIVERPFVGKWKKTLNSNLGEGKEKLLQYLSYDFPIGEVSNVWWKLDFYPRTSH